jgi:hypothetical protein
MHFNPLAAQLFVAAMKQKDVESAALFAMDVADLYLVNSMVEVEGELSDDEIVEQCEYHLREIDKGIVNFVWNIHIPAFVGIVAYWNEKNVLEYSEDGKTDSEPSVG